MRRLFALARALAYATAFISLVLVYLPVLILPTSALKPAAGIGPVEIAGMMITTAGAAVAIWCVVSFALIGGGTPAPFDAPRRLVTQGPYRFTRNPIYVGAAIAVAGVALYYRSLPLLIYDAVFMIIAHVFVVVYEEPTLVRLFGQEYESYRREVGRWLPGM